MKNIDASLKNNYIPYNTVENTQKSTESDKSSIFLYKDKNDDNIVNEADFKDSNGNVNSALIKLLEIHNWLNENWNNVGDAINKLLGNINFLEKYNEKYTLENVQYRSDGTIEKMISVYPNSGDVLEQTYDETGKHVIHEVLIDRNGKIVCTKDFAYRSDGTKEKEISTTSDGTKVEDDYDEKGKRVVKSIVYKNGQYDSTSTYKYNKNGSFQSKTTKDKYGTTTTDYYDNKGHVIRTIVNVDGTKYDTKYNKNGSNKSCIITQPDGSSEEEIYDSKGKNIIKRIKKNKNGTVEEYYDASGKKLLKEVNKKSDGKIITTEYKYRNDGSLQLKITKNDKGTTETNYANNGYDAIKKVSKNKSGKIINYYEKVLRPDGTLQTEITQNTEKRIEKIYDKSGKYVVKTVEKSKSGTYINHFDKDGNITKSESVEQINNAYYKSDKKYKKTVTDNQIIIETLGKDGKTKDKTVIDLNKLLKPFNMEERKKIIAAFRKIPGEVLLDLYKEGTYTNKEVMKGYNGHYTPFFDKIALRGGSMSAKIIVHELGHAIDFLAFRIPQTLQPKFQYIYGQELKKYEQDGHVRSTTSYNIIKGEVNIQDNDDELGCTYVTNNAKEAFAECYTLLMLGHCNSEKTIQKYFPKTLKCAKEILLETRKKSDWVRH